MDRSPTLSINGRDLNLITGELHYRGETVLLEAKVLAVFKLLYSYNGELVSQQTLLSQVWHDSIVAPNALQRCIAQLRKHLGDVDKTLLQTLPKKGYRLQLVPNEVPVVAPVRHRRWWWLGLLFMAIGVGGYVIAPNDKQYALEIRHLTYGAENAQQGLLIGDMLYYIDREAMQAKVMRKNLQTEQIELLHSATDFYGVPTLSPDGKQLAIVALEINADKKKCTSLQQIQLSNSAVETLSACAPAFIRQIYWVSASTMLAITEQQVFRVDVTTATYTALNLPIAVQQLLGGYWQGGELYLMGLDEHAQATLWRLSYQLPSGQLQLLQHTMLPYTPEFPAYFSVDANGILLHQHADTLFIYNDLELQQTLEMANAAPLQFTFAARAGQSVASQVYVDKQLVLYDETTAYLAASPFAEQDAQFQPGGEAIAFLSNRGGQNELWIQSGESTSRLPSRQAVSSFVWQQDGKALWTLHAGQLYRQPLSGGAGFVMSTAGASVLLQHLRTERTELLLVLDNAEQLWLIDVAAQTQQKMYDKAVHWAQMSQAGQIFVVTPDSPSIRRLAEGRLLSVPTLQHSVLQWRFYWRDSQLLFTDKQQQIVAYRPAEEKSQVLGQYSDDFAMATDVQAAPLRLLANTTGETQSMQVLVKLNLSQ